MSDLPMGPGCSSGCTFYTGPPIGPPTKKQKIVEVVVISLFVIGSIVTTALFIIAVFNV